MLMPETSAGRSRGATADSYGIWSSREEDRIILGATSGQLAERPQEIAKKSSNIRDPISVSRARLNYWPLAEIWITG